MRNLAINHQYYRKARVGLGFTMVSLFVGLVPASVAVETRCGWIDNPTPANWWLTDRDGAWIIGVQGGYQAEGMDNIYLGASDEYVETNVYYGYACACMDVITDKSSMRINRIYDFEQLSLATCQEDPALTQRTAISQIP